MRCAIAVVHRRNPENAENAENAEYAEYAEEFRKKTNIDFCISVLCEPLRSLRLCGKSVRPRIRRPTP